MRERRKSFRELTLKTGKVHIPGGARSVDCAVLDISDGGACVLVPNAAEIPSRFILTLDRSEATYCCEVQWKTRSRIGVRFDRSLSQAVVHDFEQARDVTDADKLPTTAT